MTVACNALYRHAALARFGVRAFASALHDDWVLVSIIKSCVLVVRKVVCKIA